MFCNSLKGNVRENMKISQQTNNRNRLVFISAIYSVLLAAITAAWAFRGWNEVYFWPFLIVWVLSAGCFLVSLVLALARKATSSAALVIAGGTLSVPIGIPATIIASLFLHTRTKQWVNRSLLAVVIAVLSIVLLIAFLPQDVRVRPWQEPEGLMRGAPFSWCRLGNLLAILKGAKYDTLRHRALICRNVSTDENVRASFAQLGYKRSDMRKVNEIILKHLNLSLQQAYNPKGEKHDGTYMQAQKEAIGYLINNLDRNILRESGLLPFLVVDDAITNEQLFTNGSRLLVKIILAFYSK